MGPAFLHGFWGSDSVSYVVMASTLLDNVPSPCLSFQPLYMEGDGLAVSTSAFMTQETETQETETQEMTGTGDPWPDSQARPIVLRLII